MKRRAMSTVKPREVTPSLDVDTLDGGRFTLGEQNPEAFTMVVFYRGLHCPVCRKYLGELDRLYDDFRDQGVEVIAVSGDIQDRALEARDEWGLQNVQIGYGLEIEKMREWGFLVSRGEGSEEPQLYGEPGLFLIRADEIVYYQAINSMPFGRPELQEMLTAIGNVKKMDIPAHGEA
jgi:alkyl hydroperoxide reductase subunit AhpC